MTQNWTDAHGQSVAAPIRPGPHLPRRRSLSLQNPRLQKMQEAGPSRSQAPQYGLQYPQLVVDERLGVPVFEVPTASALLWLVAQHMLPTATARGADAGVQNPLKCAAVSDACLRMMRSTTQVDQHEP